MASNRFSLWLDWRFTILPALSLALASAIAHQGGPFWYAANSDSAYAYLVAGLNLSELHRTGELHHPGTPTQLIIAFLIRVTHLVIGGGAELSPHVIRHAEIYLRVVQVGFLAVFGIALYLGGIVVRLATGNLGAALLSQCGPLVSTWIHFQLTRPSAEPLLLILGVVLQTTLLASLRWKMPDYPRHYVLALGMILGVGLANKFSVLPLVAVVLIACPQWSLRLKVSLATIACFFLSLLPIAFQLREAMHLVFSRGLSGRGALATLVYLAKSLPSEYGSWIATQFPTLVMLCAAAAWLAWRQRRQKETTRILFAYLVGFATTVLVCVNNPIARFFLPILSIAGLPLAAMWLLLAQVHPRMAALDFQRRVLLGALLIFVTLRGYDGFRWVKQIGRDASQARAAHSAASKLAKSCLIISAYNASSPVGAAAFGNFYGLGLQAAAMERVYGPHFHLTDAREKKFGGWFGPVTFDEVKQHAVNGCLAIQGFALNQIPKHFRSCNLVPGNRNESVHRIFIDDKSQNVVSDREIASQCDQFDN